MHLVAAIIVGVIAAAASPALGAGSVSNGRIAFVAGVGGTIQLFTIEPDGSAVTQLTHDASRVTEYGTAWAPDGSALLAVRSNGGRDTIYRFASNGNAATAISAGCAAECLGDDFPSYDRSGSRIVFERAYGPVRNNNAAAVAIVTMNADGGSVTQLTQRARPTSTEDHKPTWSPDARRIAFQRINTNARPVHASAIFVMNAGGTHVHRLTPYALDASNPKWSRDGMRILFNSHDEPAPGADANIYTIRTDGSALRQITHYSGGKLQAYVDDWSPDGRQILFHLVGTRGGTPVNAIFVMRADGRGIRRLTHMPPEANPRSASWGTAG